MSFLGILLIIFLILILRPIIRVYTFYRRYKKAVNNAYAQAQGAGSGSSRTHDREHTQPVKKKVITKDMGEYVAYEEVTVEQTSADDTSSQTSQTTQVTEEQVTDVEWEDIR